MKYKLNEEVHIAEKEQAEPSRKMIRIFDKIKSHKLFRIEIFLVVGAIAAGLVSAAISNSQQNAAMSSFSDQLARVQIIVTDKNLPAGSLISPSFLRPSAYTPGSVTKNMVLSDSMEVIIGRRTTVDLTAGDPILLTSVEGLGNQDGFAARIPPGMRLVTLPVKDNIASKGWIKPNDRVDIVANLDLPERGLTSFTMLQDVTIISIGKATIWDDGVSTIGAEIGFFAHPEEVEFINFAQGRGNFALSLRNPRDIEIREGTLGRSGVDFNAFLDHKSISGASGGGALDINVGGE